MCTKAARRQRRRYRKLGREPRLHQHLRRREKITTRIENNESDTKSAPFQRGQEKGLQAKEGKDSELADGKIYGNNGCTAGEYTLEKIWLNVAVVAILRT